MDLFDTFSTLGCFLLSFSSSLNLATFQSTKTFISMPP